MEINNDLVRENKKHGLVTHCISCEYRYFHQSFLDERRRGVTFKLGKVYCLFPKKPFRLDARKRHTDIPDNCPRRSVPVRFAVYTLKKRASAVDSDNGNANRYWRIYTGNLDMVTHRHLFGDGSYTNPDSNDGFLSDGGERVHPLEQGDMVVREDGFRIRVWQWNGEYFVSGQDFDETGIKKLPQRKGNRTQRL